MVPKTSWYVWCSVQLPGMKSLIAARPQGYTPVCYVQTHSSRANNCIQQLGLVMDAENHHSSTEATLKSNIYGCGYPAGEVRWEHAQSRTGGLRVCVCVSSQTAQTKQEFLRLQGGNVTPKTAWKKPLLM